MSNKYKAPPTPKNTDGDIKQFAKFVQTARDLETDNDTKRFDDTLGKIARFVPSVHPPVFENDGGDAQSD